MKIGHFDDWQIDIKVKLLNLNIDWQKCQIKEKMSDMPIHMGHCQTDFTPHSIHVYNP